MLFESDILHGLEKLRNELNSRIKDDCKLSEDIKIAICGKCYYTDEIRKYQEDNFYPYCECQKSIKIRVVKCKKDEVDNAGERIPEDASWPFYLFNIKFCPPRYRFIADSKYHVMVFDNPINLDVKDRIKFHERCLNKIHCKYSNEYKRLEKLYSGISYIKNTLNCKTLMRYFRINEIKLYLSDINSENIYYTSKYMKIIFKEIIEEKNNYSRERYIIQIKKLDREYRILGFRDFDNLPTESQIKSNYRKMSIKFHPEKNECIDTTDLFNKINNAYINICKSRFIDP